jgi:hypothetical protein
MYELETNIFTMFGGPRKRIDIFQGHETNPHDLIMSCSRCYETLRPFTPHTNKDNTYSEKGGDFPPPLYNAMVFYIYTPKDGT